MLEPHSVCFKLSVARLRQGELDTSTHTHTGMGPNCTKLYTSHFADVIRALTNTTEGITRAHMHACVPVPACTRVCVRCVSHLMHLTHTRVHTGTGTHACTCAHA